MLYALGAGLWLVFSVSYAVHSIRYAGSLLNDLAHPHTSHLAAYIPAIGLLLLVHFGLYARQLATWACWALVIMLAGLAARTLAAWFTGDMPEEAINPGLLLPVVAGAFIAGIAFSSVGLYPVSMAAIGVGLFFWLVIGSVVMSRLIVGGPLPANRAPLLSVLVAPPATGGIAWMAAHPANYGTAIDAFAGVLVMMIVLQAMLLPVYLRLRFSGAFWAFTFPIAASTNFLLRRLPTPMPPGWEAIGWVLLVAATLAIGYIAIRTAVASASAQKGIGLARRLRHRLASLKDPARPRTSTSIDCARKQRVRNEERTP
ncbi:hypothetical protein BCD48_05890 [Pseudofrankia sp. BMG5.36]|nr:hypothetical protein BCD48_05890 [Pseudofrankia sp. BMG5.36]